MDAGTVFAKAKNYQYAGDTGYSRDTNTTGDGDNIVANAIPAGPVGASFTLKLELWTKEKDPETNRRGAFPQDARNNNPFLFERTWTCEPGEDRFSTIIDIPRSTADPNLAETDGKVEYHWIWKAT